MTAHEGLPEAWRDFPNKLQAVRGLDNTPGDCPSAVWGAVAGVGDGYQYFRVWSDVEGLDHGKFASEVVTRYNEAPALRSALSALEARCGELEAMQPREWTAETIKDAPEGEYDVEYFVPEDDDAYWRKAMSELFFVKKDFERGDIRRAFGPIPQPPSNSRKEGEG